MSSLAGFSCCQSGLHVRFNVGTFVIFKITVLGNELVRLLFLLLLQHRVAHLHVFAAKLVPGQKLHDPGADGVPQDIGCGAQTVSRAHGDASEECERAECCTTHFQLLL